MGRGKRGQEVVQPSELGGVGGRGPGQPPSEGWAGFWGSEGPRRGGVGWGSWKAGWPTEGVGGGGGGGRRAAPSPAARLEHEPSIRPREDAAAAEPGPGLRVPPVSRVPGASGLARGGGRAERPGKMLRAGPHCPLTGALEKTPHRRARPSLRAGTQRPGGALSLHLLDALTHSPPPG